MRTKVMKCLCAAVISVMMLAATVFATEASVDWSKGIIRATGIGAPKKNETNPGLKRAQAKRAATIDAQRTLAECVNGVQITGESSIKDLALEYDVVQTRLDTIIKGMSEVSVKYFDDDTCEVVYEMPMYGSNQALATAAFMPFKNQEREPFPEPTIKADEDDSVVEGAATNNYTGLVIDCSGMKLNPVMSPVIKNDEGQSIYGYKNLDIDKVIERGMASYANNPEDSISFERAGKNPLKVKAVKLEKFNSNPVVSLDDANKILIANQSDQFLDNCAVVFVR